jgi:hypothetical protein
VERREVATEIDRRWRDYVCEAWSSLRCRSLAMQRLLPVLLKSNTGGDHFGHRPHCGFY